MSRLVRHLGLPAAWNNVGQVYPRSLDFQAVSVEGFGGDHLIVPFNEPILPADALNPVAYALTVDAAPVSLSSASVRYSSVGNQVRIDLPAGTELPNGSTVSLTVTGLRDAKSASSTSSDPASASTRTLSPSLMQAMGPPIAASGDR